MKKIAGLVLVIVILFIGASVPQFAHAEKAYQDTITIAVVNFEPIVGDKAATLEKIKDFTIKAAKQGANLIVFPETALTGYSGFPPEEAPALAETIPGPATDAIQKIAAEYNVYVCFGLIERRDDKLYNSAPVIGPTGVLGVYRKCHPFKPAEPWATPGSEYPLIETPWGPIGVGICYDNYCFPEVARSYAVKKARILLNPTAFPEFPDATDYRDFYKTMLGARAIENKMFVASANLVGREGSLTFFGYSAILGPKPGQMNYHIYAGPMGTEEGIAMATLDLASLKNLGIGVRTIFEDRRPETYLALVRREASFVIGSRTYVVNGKEYTMDVEPYLKDGRTYLPVRYVAYALGVSEDNIFYANGVVSILKGGRAVQLTIGSKTLVVNGVAITMDVAPELVSGCTMLPSRWVATALGAGVSWDEATETVTMKVE